MTQDQQAGTLAFLQNFYTGVTLYMPFEAEERTPMPDSSATVAVPAATAPPTLPVAAPAAVSPPAAAPAPVPAAAKAPAQSLPAAPETPAPPVPVVAAPGKLPSLGALPPLPAFPPVAPATTATPAAATPPRAATPVAVPPPPPVAAAPVSPHLCTTFNTLGNNAQGVVILVRLPETQFVKLPRNVFLNKLLQALQLVMADVVLVNVDGPYPVALENLRREIAATQVLAFGKNLLDVAVRTTQIYEPVLFPNLNLSYLAAAEVEMVEYDVSLKKRLWSGLKAMFL